MTKQITLKEAINNFRTEFKEPLFENIIGEVLASSEDSIVIKFTRFGIYKDAQTLIDSI